ncbi:MAG: lipoyl(octanoyl) transferase LipB [Bdellovibrionales bacterium]|nr:lipoyl(octanoyl) transferase LipB [Bdellovibrionales bacterium]
MNSSHFEWMGTISFKQSLKLQESFKKKAQNKKNYFIGFEVSHPVISLGLRADKTHILWKKKRLKKFNISVVKVRRGGQATLHAPGQLVIYPVVYLNSLGLKVKDFILFLQKVTKLFLEKYEINTTPGKDFAGLYTNKGKIAFFGIHISQGVNQNGLSINLDNDLSLFDSIKSCGHFLRLHDKMSNYQKGALEKEKLFLTWCDLFLKELKP